MTRRGGGNISDFPPLLLSPSAAGSRLQKVILTFIVDQEEKGEHEAFSGTGPFLTKNCWITKIKRSLKKHLVIK